MLTVGRGGIPRFLASLRRYIAVAARGESASIAEFAPVTAVPLEGARAVVRWRTRGTWRVRLSPGGDFLPPSGELEVLIPRGGLAVRLVAWGAHVRLERELIVRPLIRRDAVAAIRSLDQARDRIPSLGTAIERQARHLSEQMSRRMGSSRRMLVSDSTRVRFAWRGVRYARSWLDGPPAQEDGHAAE